MKCVACALLLVACASDTDSFPVQPGGGSAATGGTEQPEPGTTVLRGRVCVVDDVILRDCAITGAGNLTVSLGDQTAVTADTGTFFATLVRGGQPVSGATATSTPSPAFGPFFDSTQPAPWSLNATGASGIVFFPGVVAGPADLTFNTLTGGSAIVGGVQVINGGITMVETILP